MVVGPAPLCLACAHFHEWDEHRFTCDAFPIGIPDEIVYGGYNHKKPFAGDHGIRFRPRVKFEVTGPEGQTLTAFAREVEGRLVMGSTDRRFIARMRTLVADIDRIVSELDPEDQGEAWKAFYKIVDELLTRGGK
jgi:hypothetical protein